MLIILFFKNESIQKNNKTVLTRNNNQLLQRRGEGAYVVTFSLYLLTIITSWERGGELTTY